MKAFKKLGYKLLLVWLSVGFFGIGLAQSPPGAGGGGGGVTPGAPSSAIDMYDWVLLFVAASLIVIFAKKYKLKTI